MSKGGSVGYMRYDTVRAACTRGRGYTDRSSALLGYVAVLWEVGLVKC